MKNLFIIILIFLSSLITWGQNIYNSEVPFWINGYSADLPNSRLTVVSATGFTRMEAYNNAVKKIIENQSLATGQLNTINVDNGIVTVKGNDMLTVKAPIKDAYTVLTESGQYMTFLLVQIAKNPLFELEPVTITDKYGFSPRVFVPGMAQIHKGQNVKGALFIGGEILSVAGIIAFEGMRSSYVSKAKRTHNTADIKNYINKADNMKNIRNGFIGATAAIYAWNVIDGIVCKGKKHIEVGKPHLAFTPYSDMQSAGVLLAVTF
ncbi:MAG: hypothetical protein K2K25_04060 [Muribaculaceae bacterium]|nr:hypothetical protein [Muribaculaceae bacterium]